LPEIEFRFDEADEVFRGHAKAFFGGKIYDPSPEAKGALALSAAGFQMLFKILHRSEGDRPSYEIYPGFFCKMHSWLSGPRTLLPLIEQGRGRSRKI